MFYTLGVQDKQKSLPSTSLQNWCFLQIPRQSQHRYYTECFLFSLTFHVPQILICKYILSKISTAFFTKLEQAILKNPE